MDRLCLSFFCGFFFAAPAFAQQPAAAPKPNATPTSTPAQPASPVPTPAPHALEKSDLEAFFDGVIPIQLLRADIAGATVLVMKDNQILLKKGYGYADFSKKKPVDPDNTIFRLASISKLFTWVSVMQLAEQGKLDIDTDVNAYLDFQIAPAFGKPITLRNLMTHTGGFEEEIRDIIITDPKLASPLRNYLIDNQPRRIFPPGEIPAYSNYGVGLAGYIVQRVSGQPFEQYVHDHIFQPLGMNHSSFQQPVQEDLSLFPSRGYKNNTEQPAIGFEIFNPAPAGGISSTAADMGRFGQALLNGGELDSRRILKTQTRDLMWTRQFAASDALPAMCMGFYQTWRNNLHFIGHDGDLIAFHSMFLLEPKEKLALFISYNSAGSASRTRSEILTAFADRYYPFNPNPQYQKFPLAELKSVAGLYQPTRRSESTKLKLGELMSEAQVSVDKDGIIAVDVSKDLRGHVRKWKPIAKDLYQEVDGQSLAFTIRDANGKIVRIAGGFAGTQSERVPWYENANAMKACLSICWVIILAAALAPLGRFFRKVFFSRRPALHPQPGTIWLTRAPRLAAWAWVILVIGIGVLMSSLQDETLPPSHAIDKYFVLANWFTAVAIFASIFAIVSGSRIWRRSDLRLITRFKFSLVALACLFLTWFSIHWNVIGPAHRF